MVPILVSIPFLLLSFIIIILINFRLAASTVISSRKANRTVAHLKRIFFRYRHGGVYDGAHLRFTIQSDPEGKKKKKVGYVTGTFFNDLDLTADSCLRIRANK